MSAIYKLYKLGNLGGQLACLYRASYRGRPVQASYLAPGGPYKLYKLGLELER